MQSEPSKNAGSVSTESAAAPPALVSLPQWQRGRSRDAGRRATETAACTPQSRSSARPGSARFERPRHAAYAMAARRSSAPCGSALPAHVDAAACRRHDGLQQVGRGRARHAAGPPFACETVASSSSTCCARPLSIAPPGLHHPFADRRRTTRHEERRAGIQQHHIASRTGPGRRAPRAPSPRWSRASPPRSALEAGLRNAVLGRVHVEGLHGPVATLRHLV